MNLAITVCRAGGREAKRTGLVVQARSIWSQRRMIWFAACSGVRLVLMCSLALGLCDFSLRHGMELGRHSGGRGLSRIWLSCLAGGYGRLTTVPGLALMAAHGKFRVRAGRRLVSQRL